MAKQDHPLYHIWRNAKRRCQDPNNPAYGRYGGRGIQFSEAWEDIDRFATDMGPRPHRATLERIDNNSGYHSGNCCWATYSAQNRNKRSSKRITHNGVTMLAVEWAEHLGLHQDAFALRRRRMSDCDAIQMGGPKRKSERRMLKQCASI